MTLLVASYILMLWLLGRRHPVVEDMLLFTGPLSALLVLPDILLVRAMEILVFAQDEAPLLGGAVPIYMAGVRVIPLTVIIWLGLTLEDMDGYRSARACTKAWPRVLLCSAVVFTAGEGFSWLFGGWHSVEAVTWDELTGQQALILEYAPVYMLVPQLALGVGAWSTYRSTALFNQMAVKLILAVLLTAGYAGIAVLSYSTLDRIFLAGVR